MKWNRLAEKYAVVAFLLVISVVLPQLSFGDVLTPEKFWQLVKQETGDYGKMVERRTIRVLVPYSRTFFFFDGVTPKGLSYEAVQQFEKYVNTREKRTGGSRIHVMILPTAREDLLSHLQKGLGDIALGNLTSTPERRELVAFSDPLLTGVNEILVTSRKHKAVNSIEELSGQKVHLRASSSYYEHLRQLNEGFKNKGLKPISIVLVDDHLEDEDILEMASAGMLDRTVVDAHKAEFWSQILDGIKLHRGIAINTGGEIGWAVRKDNPMLLEVVNGFVKKNRKGTLLGNVLFNKYLKNTKYITNATESRNYKRFNNLKGYFQKYGDVYGHDYLLLAAQGYQESQLDQSVRSVAGAIGVMQLLPTTARDRNVNIPDITKVENNIHAGAKYLKHLEDTYFPESEGINKYNRALMTIASYNAGPARIRSLRKEAAEAGYDPNVWFNNVEIVVARRVGRETVDYVRNILKYYVGYKLLEEKMSQTGDI